VEHDQHATVDCLDASIQDLATCKCLVIFQLDPKDRLIRHCRSGPIHQLDASSQRNRATESQLRRTRVRFALLPEQHELDADRLLVLLRFDLAFSPH